MPPRQITNERRRTDVPELLGGPGARRLDNVLDTSRVWQEEDIAPEDVFEHELEEAQNLTVGTHSTVDHTGLPGVPAPEAFDSAAHATTNHASLPGVAQTLAQVLGNGRVTGGTSIEVTAGDQVKFLNGGAPGAVHVLGPLDQDLLIRTPDAVGDTSARNIVLRGGDCNGDAGDGGGVYLYGGYSKEDSYGDIRFYWGGAYPVLAWRVFGDNGDLYPGADNAVHIGTPDGSSPPYRPASVNVSSHIRVGDGGTIWHNTELVFRNDVGIKRSSANVILVTDGGVGEGDLSARFLHGRAIRFVDGASIGGEWSGTNGTGIKLGAAHVLAWTGGSAYSAYRVALLSHVSRVLRLQESPLGGGPFDGAAIELAECFTSPGTPGVGSARLRLKDNGVGKMQLVVEFPTGGDIALATEP